jgi:hypothetical protein
MQVTEQEVKILGSPHRYKYSTTLERIQENWATVSIKAGNSSNFNLSLTHNKLQGGTAALLQNAAEVVAARGTKDRRAPARFPMENYFGGNGI